MTNRTSRPDRPGFTLIEIVVVSVMMTLMALLMAGAWTAFGRPAVDVDARARLAQEAALAVEALSRDLSGYYPSPDETRVGTIQSSQFYDWSASDGASLTLYYFGPEANPDTSKHYTSPPDQVVTYQLVGDRLVRWDQSAGTSVAVARYVSNLEVAPSGSNMTINITMSYGWNTWTKQPFTRTYQLVGVHP